MAENNPLNRRRFLAAAGAAGVGAVTLGHHAAAEPDTTEESIVYIGSFSTGGDPPGNGLEVGVVDPATGELTVSHVVPDVPDASFVAFSADRKTMYTTNERSEGTVTALDIGTDPAHPVVRNRRSSRGAAPTHLSVHPSGRYLLTANYTDGTVVVHELAGDGGIGESTDLVRHTGTDRDPHAHQILTDPSGQWVLAVDLGADSVYVYALDTGSGTLDQRQRLRLPTGAGPRHLAFHPEYDVAYILGELRPEITVARWDPDAGELTPGQVLPTVGKDAPRTYPAEIAVSGDGRFVYASNRGDDTIATFAVHGCGRRLERTATTPTGGAWPRHFTLSQDERTLYVSNQRSNTVDRLPRDPDTGAVYPSVGTTEVNSVGITLFHPSRKA